MRNAENIEKWGTDRDAYFATKRTTGKFPTVEYVPTPKQEPIQQPKAKPQAKPQEAQKPKTSQPMDAQYEVVKPHPGRILVNCFGASLLHMGIQAGLWYVFKMGSIDADGAIVGTIANCIAAGWRICWRFKV